VLNRWCAPPKWIERWLTMAGRFFMNSQLLAVRDTNRKRIRGLYLQVRLPGESASAQIPTDRFQGAYKG
jgi:hypothetical protein